MSEVFSEPRYYLFRYLAKEDEFVRSITELPERERFKGLSWLMFQALSGVVKQVKQNKLYLDALAKVAERFLLPYEWGLEAIHEASRSLYETKKKDGSIDYTFLLQSEWTPSRIRVNESLEDDRRVFSISAPLDYLKKELHEALDIYLREAEEDKKYEGAIPPIIVLGKSAKRVTRSTLDMDMTLLARKLCHPDQVYGQIWRWYRETYPNRVEWQDTRRKRKKEEKYCAQDHTGDVARQAIGRACKATGISYSRIRTLSQNVKPA